MATRYTLLFPALLGLVALGTVGVYQATVLDEYPESTASSQDPGNRRGSRSPSNVSTDGTSAIQPKSQSDATEARRAPLANSSIGLGTLKIIVRGKESGHALAGRMIEVSRLMFSEAVKTGETDEDGVLVCRLLPSGEWYVGVEDGFRTNRVEVLPNETTALEILGTDGMSVRGRVVDGSGQPVPSARVWLSTGPITCAGEIVTTCDSQGRFVLDDVPRYRALSAYADGYQFAMPVAFFWMKKPDVQVVLQHRGIPLQGVVLDTAGNPIVGARVSVGHFPCTNVKSAFAHDGSVLDDDLRPPLLILQTDSNGVFQTSSAPGGRVPIDIDAAGYGPKFMTVDLPLPANRAMEITLPRAATVKGTVRSGDGSTPSGVMVRISAGDSETSPWVGRATLTAGDGTFTLRDVPPGTVRVKIWDEQWGFRSAELTVASGATVQWNPTLYDGGRVLSGRLFDLSRTPQAGWRVVAIAEQGEHVGLHFQRNIKTDQRGSFRFVFCIDGPYTLFAYPPGPKQPTELDLLTRRGGIPPQVAPPSPTNIHRGLWPGGEHVLVVSKPSHVSSPPPSSR